MKCREHDEASPCRVGYLRDSKEKSADEVMVEYANTNRGKNGRNQRYN